MVVTSALHADTCRCCVSVRGRLDADATAALRRTLVTAAAAGYVEVVVDLREVEALRPEAVGVLLRAKQALVLRGGWLRLVLEPGIARGTLRTLGVAERFPTFRTAELAGWVEGPTTYSWPMQPTGRATGVPRQRQR